MERRGRVVPCMSGRREGAGGLDPPTDVDGGLAGPGPCAQGSSSHDGACIRAPPQPTSRGVARQTNWGCRVCGESGVTQAQHANPIQDAICSTRGESLSEAWYLVRPYSSD
eukprot:2304449-Prymnesium_polylepis.2